MELLEASVDDISAVSDGVGLGVSGVPDRMLSWPRLVVAAREKGDPLAAALDVTQDGATFPFGSHVSVVEVDLDTGFVRPVTHIAVDDCERVLNPLTAVGGVSRASADWLWQSVSHSIA